MLSVHCPSCGGTNIFDETKQIPTYCAFCGKHLPDMTTFVQESLKLGLDKQQLDIDRQRHQMELETIDKDIKRTKAKISGEKLGYIAIIVGLIFFGYIIFSVRH